LKNIDELYTTADHNGETLYFIDALLAIPYTGIVVDKSDNIVEWMFETVNGKQEGLEKTYFPNGKLKQIAEYKNNLQYGVSKEYDQEGNMTSASIVWNNGYIKTLVINEGQVVSVDEKHFADNTKIPDRISYLLELSQKELINYQFDNR